MDTENINVPKCKNLDTRREAFALLKIIAQEKSEFLEKTIKFLQQFHNNASSRGNKNEDWNKLTVFLERSSTGFVGLKNLGSTCYMNSIIQ